MRIPIVAKHTLVGAMQPWTGISALSPGSSFAPHHDFQHLAYSGLR